MSIWQDFEDVAAGRIDSWTMACTIELEDRLRRGSLVDAFWLWVSR